MKHYKAEDLWNFSRREEFAGHFGFWQLLVWMDLMLDEMPSCVIETGTHHGHGSFRFATFFEEVHTVELSEDLYEMASKKYADIPNITFHHGTSVDCLKKLLPKQTSPCLIFLDAHGSGGDTVYDPDVGRYGTPVIAELDAIKEFSNTNEHIIVIDDIDCADTLDVWPSKDEIAEKLRSINPNYYIDMDVPAHLLMSHGTGLAIPVK